jgi:hypothetical protein
MKHWFRFLFLFFSFQLQAQNPALDHLEMLYDQGYYKMVYRKSTRLLDKPEYDFSKLPAYYKAISSLQLAQDEHWFKRHQTILTESRKVLLNLRESQDGQKIMRAHVLELSYLKKDLDSWLLEGSLAKDFDKRGWREFVQELFADMNLVEFDEQQDEFELSNRPELKSRIELIEVAKKQLGVPYVSAGMDPSGFDCSGFTSYVMAQNDIKIPRRAKDQYDACLKLTESEAQIGDFVFFSNGGEVSHVGILVNEKGQAKKMIHASSSKGISIVQIEASTYWEPRIVGYGTFITGKK